jgi:hypothetical protein
LSRRARHAALAGEPLDRISRYEGRLCRQFLQTLHALDKARNQHLVTSRGRFTRYPPQW